MPRAEGRTKKNPHRTLAARGVTGSGYDIRLAKNLHQTLSGNSATRWILCPWIKRFPTETGIWLSVLSAHDVNEGLLEALPASKRTWPRVYAGVFAVDTLRQTAQLIRQIKSAGIAGVINFPSTSFIDGEAGAVLAGLSLGIDREIGFLQACSKEGLGIAGVTNSPAAAHLLVKLGVDFLIAHGGPPTRNSADPSLSVAKQVERIARGGNIPVIPMSRVRCLSARAAG
jgi:predicted TIM-barrel enzyme